MVNQVGQSMMGRPAQREVAGTWPPPRRMPQEGAGEHLGEEKKKIRFPTWLVVIIIIVFLGIVGLIWWLV
jgi:hypothetical protein